MRKALRWIKLAWRLVSDFETVRGVLGMLGVSVTVVATVLMALPGWAIVTATIGIGLAANLAVGAYGTWRRKRMESRLELQRLQIENLRITKQDRV